jgi:hypothetical protein
LSRCRRFTRFLVALAAHPLWITAALPVNRRSDGDIARSLRSIPVMDDPKFHQHGGAHSAEHPPHGPYWKRMHRSAFFWIAAFFILLALGIYVMTDSLSLLPGGRARKPVPAIAP